MPENPLGETLDSIMPAFRRYHTEAALIGRMLAGYGELEFELHVCLGQALGNDETALRTMFRTRGEKQRILTADALMRHLYINAGFETQYCEEIGAMHWCRICRNQYAHCHWWDDENGLYFVNLETAAQKTLGTIYLQFRHLDIPLLQQQEAFFQYTLRLLTFINQEFRAKAGGHPNRVHKEPKKLPRPNRYSPQGTYPLPQIERDSQNPTQEPAPE